MAIDATHINAYLAAWGAAGPMVGIVVGHVLTRTWQREQWRLDNRKEEFRELVSVLEQASLERANYLARARAGQEADEKRWYDAYLLAQRTVQDRIYIAEDIDRLMIGVRFFKYFDDLQNGGDVKAIGAQMDALMSDLKRAARKG